MLKRLQYSQLFKELKQSEIDDLLSNVRYNTQNYRKGSLIVSRGEKCENLLIILKGKITAGMLDENGNFLQVETLKAPQILAPAFLFGERPLYPVNAMASSDVVFLSLPKESLFHLISNNQKVLVNYLNLLSSKTQFLTERIRLFALKTIRQKLSAYILERLPKGEEKVKMDRTQKDLADFFGVSRPALARVIGELKEEKILEEIAPKMIKVNKRKLKSLLHQE